LKTDTGVLTNLQTVQVKRLRELGQTVEVVKGDSRIDQIFREIRISASEHSTFRKIQRGENRWSLNHTAIRNTVLKRSSR
jgi:hypothetical protein